MVIVGRVRMRVSTWSMDRRLFRGADQAEHWPRLRDSFLTRALMRIRPAGLHSEPPAPPDREASRQASRQAPTRRPGGSCGWPSSRPVPSSKQSGAEADEHGHVASIVRGADTPLIRRICLTVPYRDRYFLRAGAVAVQ